MRLVSDTFSAYQGAVFVMSLLLMEFNVMSALIITGTVALTVLNMLGAMGWVCIPLNAVSLVTVGVVS